MGDADRVTASRNGIPAKVDIPAMATRGGELRERRLMIVFVDWIVQDILL